MNKHLCTTNAIADAGLPRFYRDRLPFHRDKLSWLKHLISLQTFTDKSVQVVLADN